MKEKKECKIVQDILPNYLENLTSNETNEFVEEHIKTCEECTRVLDSMKKDIEVNAKRSSDKEVKYIKKYNRKLKIFRNAFLIIIALFAVRYGTLFGTRLYMVGGSILRTQMAVKANKDNLYRETREYNGSSMDKTITYTKDGAYLVEMEEYKGKEKDEKIVYEVIPNSRRLIYQSNNEYLSVLDGARTSTQKEKETGIKYAEHKTALIRHMDNNLDYDYDYTLPYWCNLINFKDILKLTLFGDIHRVKFDEKDCYEIKDDEQRWYFDVKTGLPVAYYDDSQMHLEEYEIKFGELTDEDVKKPELNGYHVIEIYEDGDKIKQEREYDCSENGEILNERTSVKK